MAAVPDLTSVLIFEKESDEELLSVWVYPKIEKSLKQTLIEKCTSLMTEHEGIKYCFGQSEKIWYYIKASDSKEKEIKPRVTDIYVVILAQNFNPQLYEELAKVCMKCYLKSNTSDVLTQYLSMYTKGYCTKDDNTKVMHTDFNKKKAYLQTCLKELVTLFGMESILIYTALVLKKRIVVYSPKLNTLLDVCRSLPAFVFHRLNWNIVHPFVHLKEEELSTLKPLRTYVAGFTDVAVENRTDLYDLFLNVPDGEVVINPQSKEYFQMGKMHKGIAKYMVLAAQGEDTTDEDVIRELMKRTRDIISNLKSLDEDNPENPQITLAILQERNFTNVMQSFLFNLASAEGIVRL